MCKYYGLAAKPAVCGGYTADAKKMPIKYLCPQSCGLCSSKCTCAEFRFTNDMLAYSNCIQNICSPILSTFVMTPHI